MHAATLFGNLQSFMRQVLDQALATQALRHSLSSRLRVSVRPDRWREGACWTPRASASPLPCLEVGAVAEPGGWQVRMCSPPQALAEHLPGQAVSWLWGRAVRAGPLSWDATKRSHPPVTACRGMHCPRWGESPLCPERV